MIPVMFHLSRGQKNQIEFVDIDEDSMSQDSEEIQRAIQEFHRQGWEVKGVYTPKKVGDV